MDKVRGNLFHQNISDQFICIQACSYKLRRNDRNECNQSSDVGFEKLACYVDVSESSALGERLLRKEVVSQLSCGIAEVIFTLELGGQIG